MDGEPVSENLPNSIPISNIFDAKIVLDLPILFVKNTLECTTFIIHTCKLIIFFIHTV